METSLKTKSKNYSEIEAKIKPLVDALSVAGFKTIASCEGHFFRQRAPYLYFQGPLEAVAKLEKMIRQQSWAEDSKLHSDWLLIGRFNERFELTFGLISPEYERAAGSFTSSLWTLFIKRHRIDSDILLLAQAVKQSQRLQLW